MNKLLTLVVLAFFAVPIIFAQERIVYVHDTVYVEKPANDDAANIQKNGFGAKLRASNLHLNLEMQTKYLWRGQEYGNNDKDDETFNW